MFNAQCVNSQKAERRWLCRKCMKLVFAVCGLNLISDTNLIGDFNSDVTKLDTNLIEHYFWTNFRISEPNVQCTVRQFTKGREKTVSAAHEACFCRRFRMLQFCERRKAFLLLYAIWILFLIFFLLFQNIWAQCSMHSASIHKRQRGDCVGG